MAKFAFTRDPPAPDRPPIPRIDDHPEFQERAAIRSVLLQAKTMRQAQYDLLTVIAGLQDEPIGPRRDRQAELTDRLRRAADMPVSIPTPAERDGLPAALADALDLIKGTAIGPTIDADERKKRLKQELAVISTGLAVAEQRLTETREALTAEVAQSVLPFHRSQLRAIYENAAALAEAVQAERATISEFILAGYSDATAILLRPSLSAAGRLGALDQPESEISLFRKRLTELGIVP